MILEDHQRKGKTLVPPLLATGSNVEQTTWHVERLPELFWIALVSDRLGRTQAFDLVFEMAKGIETTISRIRGDNKAIRAYALSEHLGLSEAEREQIVSDHQDSKWLKALAPIFLGIMSFWPEFPGKYLVVNKSSVEIADTFTVDVIRSILTQCLHRYDRVALDIQAIALATELRLGHMYFVTNVDIPDLNAVFEYPATDESKHAAAFIVTTCNSMIMLLNRSPEKPRFISQRSFWNYCYRMQGCEHD